MAVCLFCQIVDKKLPADIVHETPTTLAFRDIHPAAPVHVLVVPKEHVVNLLGLESKHAELLGQIHATIQSVARSEKLDQTGFRVAVNCGPDAGQAVAHLHYHVLGGKRLGWPPG